MMQESTTILKPLKRISPSRYTAINRCPYRVVLANSCSSPLLPYPPASHLGNVIHECIRFIVIGKIGTSAEFDEIWNRLLVKEGKKLEDMGFGFFTPLSENVSGYTIKKLQVKSLLKSRIKTEVQEERKTDTNILTEKWLEAQDSLIGGYADIIINLNGYIKLSDFKSGKILLEEGEIKEEYEDQLKLYAYLHNEVFGNYPDELSIIDLEKKEYRVAFTPQECEALAHKSTEALSEINSLIEKDERKALAKPDLDHCKSCLYRPACDFYWGLPLSETDSIFRDVRGNVAAVKQFRNGNLNATLNKGDSELTVSHINGEHLSFLTSVVGKEVAFYNVKQGGIPERYQALKTIQVYEA
ncbi:Inactivated superfamily I helicase [Salinivirga cyanobacteriivorans]|uniref:Inactivated superfamily I helicase n=1 Tax=Salinivirga cyanobacteriivorans TaxID=1307839 RepID=A0A0S2I372_9BACT|nr:PD-(D/E)XK nuclease family protein [Salinivirga cyanobacteriivorans]ALO16790.1 Inactivated superfamily I helicase [Salinivirga cyanobacteriivorans]